MQKFPRFPIVWLFTSIFFNPTARKRDASPSVNNSPNLEDKRVIPAGPKFGKYMEDILFIFFFKAHCDLLIDLHCYLIPELHSGLVIDILRFGHWIALWVCYWVNQIFLRSSHWVILIILLCGLWVIPFILRSGRAHTCTHEFDEPVKRSLQGWSLDSISKHECFVTSTEECLWVYTCLNMLSCMYIESVLDYFLWIEIN